MSRLDLLIFMSCVVAIVLLLTKKQLLGAGAAASAAGTPPEQARTFEEKVLQAMSRAMEQSAARASDAQP